MMETERKRVIFKYKKRNWVIEANIKTDYYKLGQTDSCLSVRRLQLRHFSSVSKQVSCSTAKYLHRQMPFNRKGTS